MNLELLLVQDLDPDLLPRRIFIIMVITWSLKRSSTKEYFVAFNVDGSDWLPSLGNHKKISVDSTYKLLKPVLMTDFIQRNVEQLCRACCLCSGNNATLDHVVVLFKRARPSMEDVVSMRAF